MSVTDPTLPLDDQAQAFIILAAIDPATKKPFPATINPVTGELITGAGTGALLTEPKSGTKVISVTDTAEVISSVATNYPKGASLVADDGNTDTIWIGDSTVTIGSNGVPLAPGESIPYDGIDLNKLYSRGTLGDQVHWLAAKTL